MMLLAGERFGRQPIDNVDGSGGTRDYPDRDGTIQFPDRCRYDLGGLNSRHRGGVAAGFLAVWITGAATRTAGSRRKSP